MRVHVHEDADNYQLWKCGIGNLAITIFVAPFDDTNLDRTLFEYECTTRSSLIGPPLIALAYLGCQPHEVYLFIIIIIRGYKLQNEDLSIMLLMLRTSVCGFLSLNARIVIYRL
eukprot:SAG31_NODE_13705_length_852_cov_1.071713_1_plen_114_part_00